MRRLATAVSILSLLAASCAAEDLGRELPMCGIDIDEVPTSAVLVLQAVPTAQYIPCMEELPVGWELGHVTAESGRAAFVVDSDQLGDRFLTVTVLESCDPGEAVRSQGTEAGTRFWVDVHEEVASVAVQVLPVAPRHGSYAERVAASLSTNETHGLLVDAAAAPSTEPMADRIEAGHAAGAVVLIVDDTDVYNGTVSLRHPDGSETIGLRIEDVLDGIGRTAPDPAYRATWYYTFPGGCVVMDIDAEGRDAASVAEEITASIALRDVSGLREQVRQAGYQSVG
jgi:Anticodon binding domain